MMDNLELAFFPLLPANVIIALATAGLCLLLLSFYFRREIIITRLLLSGLFLFYLCGPSLQEETRLPLKDTALVITDTSASQRLGNREQTTKKILEHLESSFEKNPNLDYIQIESGSIDQSKTALSGDLSKALDNIPPNRRAGVIIITDGQVHDDLSAFAPEETGPVHVMLTGKEDEKDRYIELIESPTYGIVGQGVRVKFKIRQNPENGAAALPVTLTTDGKEQKTETLQTGEEYSFLLDITHPGANFFELSVPALEDELTNVNNRISFSVNGIRDRLKVLLVSGKPHMGARMWRNLLKSDPAVDLVHFTILRQPDKRDNVPQRELSLIPFPFQELFEEKLYDFDLIIFDRYTLNRILPPFYFQNIANYVLEGGALLEASGPEYAGENSIYNTALKSLLPGRPTGEIFEQSYSPSLTETGQHHPITNIIGKTKNGPWLRQIKTELQNPKDRILFQGVNNAPLLITGLREKGRVAQITSDQIWLWERGFQGGGAHTQILRRLVHWLMKEPELEEEKLGITARGKEALIKLRLLNAETETLFVSLEKPDATTTEIPLIHDKDSGVYTASFVPDKPGLYKASYQDMTALYAAGDLKSLEFQNALTTEEKLENLTKQTGGTFTWAGDNALPDLRHIPANRKMHGFNWIGLRNNEAYAVNSTSARPLFSPLIWLALFSSALLLGWLRESKT